MWTFLTSCFEIVADSQEVAKIMQGGRVPFTKSRPTVESQVITVQYQDQEVHMDTMHVPSSMSFCRLCNHPCR